MLMNEAERENGKRVVEVRHEEEERRREQRRVGAAGRTSKEDGGSQKRQQISVNHHLWACVRSCRRAGLPPLMIGPKSNAWELGPVDGYSAIVNLSNRAERKIFPRGLHRPLTGLLIDWIRMSRMDTTWSSAQNVLPVNLRAFTWNCHICTVRFDTRLGPLVPPPYKYRTNWIRQ